MKKEEREVGQEKRKVNVLYKPERAASEIPAAGCLVLGPPQGRL